MWPKPGPPVISLAEVVGSMSATKTATGLTTEPDAVRVGPEYVSAGRVALLITGLNMSCILPLSVFGAVLIASERGWL